MNPKRMLTLLLALSLLALSACAVPTQPLDSSHRAERDPQPDSVEAEQDPVGVPEGSASALETEDNARSEEELQSLAVFLRSALSGVQSLAEQWSDANYASLMISGPADLLAEVERTANAVSGLPQQALFFDLSGADNLLMASEYYAAASAEIRFLRQTEYLTTLYSEYFNGFGNSLGNFEMVLSSLLSDTSVEPAFRDFPETAILLLDYEESCALILAQRTPHNLLQLSIRLSGQRLDLSVFLSVLQEAGFSGAAEELDIDELRNMPAQPRLLVAEPVADDPDDFRSAIVPELLSLLQENCRIPFVDSLNESLYGTLDIFANTLKQDPTEILLWEGVDFNEQVISQLLEETGEDPASGEYLPSTLARMALLRSLPVLFWNNDTVAFSAAQLSQISIYLPAPDDWQGSDVIWVSLGGTYDVCIRLLPAGDNYVKAMIQMCSPVESFRDNQMFELLQQSCRSVSTPDPEQLGL